MKKTSKIDTNFLIIRNYRDYSSQPPIDVSYLLGEINKKNHDRPLNIILDSFSFDIDAAFKIAEYLKNNEIKYYTWLLSATGSFSTILSLGADHIFMTPYASLAAIDASFYMHKFPVVNELGILHNLNPCEFTPWLKIVKESLGTDEAYLKFQDMNEHFLPEQARLSAIDCYRTIKQEIVELAYEKYLGKSASIADFFMESLGKFDISAYFSELKSIGLAVSLITEEDLKMMKLTEGD